MDTSPTPPATSADAIAIHQKIGLLTRQLHDSLNELGYADQLRGTMDELPDAQSRLTYIARLTGEAAEKVLGRVDLAKEQHDHLAAETKRVTNALVQDPVRAVASGEIMNYLTDVAGITKAADEHLTEIMMAQDFHDLTGQVIARVVTLAATIEKQLVQLLIQTAPANVVPPAIEKPHEHLSGPVVNPETATDVVTDQSQVDDLLASLGF
ncbi:MAG: protein phosphatase CheZ [Giesbergeria sp.]|nr:protein phosphatase CheZ [Giesbergeria sp.]MBP7916336.1 protein phosphatase CheZ [Giesbergeria sp.]MBP8028819.1 protein phosphatase CheZ [Giesbergeria sp.]MBP8839863.1 protein phosphatase CheZ [Giesbergeria sp.]